MINDHHYISFLIIAISCYQYYTINIIYYHAYIFFIFTLTKFI